MIAEVPEKDDSRKKSAIRWAAAYKRTCSRGHEYPAKLDACPECNSDPGAYLRQVVALSSGNSGRLNYTGKNWLGRRS